MDKCLVFILDRSGSMKDLQNDTISGFNSLIEKQKKEPGRTIVTTALFDNEYILVHENSDIQDVKELTLKDCYARGTTALYDAIGNTIDKVGLYLHQLPEDQRPKKIVVTIITDGEENASREFTQHQIKEMIKHQTEKYNWEFIYLGANVDSYTNAQNLYINTYSDYTPSSVGTQSVYNVVNTALSKEGKIENSDLRGIV